MERSHIDTTGKQNAMQVFYWTRAFLLKLDGFRAVAITSGGRVHLRSRNDKDFNSRYPAIVHALTAMPEETVIDGEIVATDESGRPSFSALQNYSDGATRVLYYVFDVMILAGKEVMKEPLTVRRELLQERLTQFQEHYHEERNHQGENNVVLFPAPARLEPSRRRGIRCRERLGGSLRYYSRAG